VRKLNPDEAGVWSRVAKTVRPLKAKDKAAGRQGDEPPPALGAHNQQVYGDVLGYSAERLKTLRADGVI